MTLVLSKPISKRTTNIPGYCERLNVHYNGSDKIDKDEMGQKVYIKNMVCDRCILVVRELLDDMKIAYKNVQLGEIELMEECQEDKLQPLREQLRGVGFEMLDDKKSRLVEKIKSSIIQLIHDSTADDLNRKLSVVLSEKTNMDYHYLAGLFSSVEGITIEKYVILQRVEKVKELLIYDELTVSQIADALGYSSLQHLSQQFKKVTGLTPSHFKMLKENKRKPLDKV
jgi:AraC family transcriptional regulator